MKNSKPNDETSRDDLDEPCDPERLKVLEGAMREAIHAYLRYSDPENRMSPDEVLGQLMDVLDRREVAEAANVDPSTITDTSHEQASPHTNDSPTVRRVV
jgi:hypothetical protein